MDLNLLVQRVAARAPIDPDDLVPLLCQEKSQARCEANARLAQAYAAIGDYRQARVFAQRAWVLSGFSEGLLPLYIEICSGIGDHAAIREAYKRLGVKKAQEHHHAKAIEYFMLSHCTYARCSGLDHWEYDFDVLGCIREMAATHRLTPRRVDNLHGPGKIRVACLTHALGSPTSVFNRIDRLYARHHDRSMFDVVFYSIEPKSAFQDRDIIPFIETCGSKVVTGAEIGDELARLLWIAQAICDFRPDLLVTDAALADLRQYFVIALQPAPVVVSHVYGPPPLYVPPGVDWAISATKHPMMDCPGDGSIINLELDVSGHDALEPLSKRDLQIPEDGCVLMSGGRPAKFQDAEFWKTIVRVLAAHPHSYYVALGVAPGQVPFLQDIVPCEFAARIVLPGWKADYLRTLAAADVVIDTFPSGSGLVLVDAMALGIPVVTFENNYLHVYDQTDWSAGAEFIPSSALSARRGDFVQLGSIISKLITDKPHYLCMSQLCREQIRLTHGNPERMVRSHEEVYRRIVSRKRDAAGTAHDRNSRRPATPKGSGRKMSLWVMKHLPLDSRFFHALQSGLSRIKHFALRTRRPG